MKLVTTAIDYANGEPHVGHAYEKVLADAIARKNGAKLFMGMDEHGSKIQKAAAQGQTDPQNYVDEWNDHFIAMWLRLDVNANYWCRTTDENHKKRVQNTLTLLHDQGYIYQDVYEGLYSPKEERYVKDSEKELFPDAVWHKEDAWFFDIESVLNFPTVTPSHHLSKLAHDVENDLCISRKKSAVSWGIELPFDNTCVTYVWFDALLSYLTFTEEEFGSDVLQIIGKDIWFPAHGLYWLNMLTKLGIDHPQFLVHGWWLDKNRKLSKSEGNAPSLWHLLDKYGCTALRWYLLSAGVGQDVEFDENTLKAKYNELLNNIGNLSNRVAAMIRKYGYNNMLPWDFPDLNGWKHYDTAGVQKEILEFASSCNVNIDNAAPWNLYKTAPENCKDFLGVLRISIIQIAEWLSPLIPSVAEKIKQQMTTFDATPVLEKLKCSLNK